VKRPEPIKGSECMFCLEIKPLLMPVPMAPGWPVIVWPCLCLDCRVNARSDEWASLGWEMEHHPRRETRKAYAEWLEASL